MSRPVLLLLAIAALSLAEDKPHRWRIRGDFSEACSCNVPCTCNFGERPSPYEYCYTMWSYAVRQGNWDGMKLDGMRVGGVDGPLGALGLLDVRASAEQRPGMENIWHLLSGRLFCLMRLWPFKAGGSIIRTRYPERQFLGFEYVSIEQVITAKGMRLSFAGKGGFEANFLVGRDPSKPITVTNNVSWPIPVSIKAKTIFLKYSDKFNQLDYQGTNANQGEFDISHRDVGAIPMSPLK
jgi:hypothetical protein